MSDSFTAPSRGGNYIHGLLAFVERWPTRAEQTLPPSGALITGEAGNINIDGRPGLLVHVDALPIDAGLQQRLDLAIEVLLGR